MNRTEFKYCPLCATPLEWRTIYRQMRSVCPNCGFVHFTDPKVAVIALITHKDKILLARRAVDPAKGKWALPGGYMDADEMPEAALQRELTEELHLEVQIVQLLDIFPLVVADERKRGIVLAYHAVPATPQQPTLICDDDVSEADWFMDEAIPTDLAFESTLVLLERWRTARL